MAEEQDGIDYDSDEFADILKEDTRYDARAYAFILAAVKDVTDTDDGPKQVGAHELLDGIADFALDEFGPMTYTVFTEWGVKSTEDIGEIVYHLVDTHRIGKSDTDDRADFIGGFDFREEFLAPYEA